MGLVRDRSEEEEAADEIDVCCLSLFRSFNK